MIHHYNETNSTQIARILHFPMADHGRQGLNICNRCDNIVI